MKKYVPVSGPNGVDFVVQDQSIFLDVKLSLNEPKLEEAFFNLGKLEFYDL